MRYSCFGVKEGSGEKQRADRQVLVNQRPVDAIPGRREFRPVHARPGRGLRPGAVLLHRPVRPGHGIRRLRRAWRLRRRDLPRRRGQARVHRVLDVTGPGRGRHECEHLGRDRRDPGSDPLRPDRRSGPPRRPGGPPGRGHQRALSRGEEVHMTGVTDAPPALPAKEAGFLGELGQQLRADSIRCSTAAGSGHPTSAMSAADLMAVLLARHLHYDWGNPGEPGNDHLIFSKGHASPLLYAMFKAAGVISDEELVTGFRRFGSRLQGHPTPVLPWVDVATGSLGQGLPYGVGIALAGRRLDRLPYQVWVLCGDSEMAEGSMWEALDKAAYYRLGNLTAIVDVNRLGQRGASPCISACAPPASWLPTGSPPGSSTCTR